MRSSTEFGLGVLGQIGVWLVGLMLALAVLALLWLLFRLAPHSRPLGEDWQPEDEESLNRAGLETFPIVTVERGIRAMATHESPHTDRDDDGSEWGT